MQTWLYKKLDYNNIQLYVSVSVSPNLITTTFSSYVSPIKSHLTLYMGREQRRHNTLPYSIWLNNTSCNRPDEGSDWAETSSTKE